MPIYEYQCKDCSQTLEVMQKFSDPPLEKCPACGALALSKLISRTSFQLKGSGWYATDYKKAPADSAGKKTSTKKPETSSESPKAEAKDSHTHHAGCSHGKVKPSGD